LLESALDAVVMMDEHGDIIEFNPAAEAMFGHKREDVLGRPLANVIVPPAFRERHRAGVARYLATGESRILGGRTELSAMRADHSEFPVELTVLRVDAPGAPLFAATIRDLSERVGAERRRDAQPAVTRVLSETSTLGDAAPRILEAIADGLGWDVGLLWLVDDSSAVLRREASYSNRPEELAPFLSATDMVTLRRGDGVAGRVWQARRALWFADVTREGTLPPVQAEQAGGLRAAFGFPVRGGRGVLGVLEFFSTDRQPPDADLLAMMESAGSQFGQFIERREIEEATRLQTAILESQSEATIDGIAITSSDGRVLSYNHRFSEMFGVPVQPAAGSEAAELARTIFAGLEGGEERVQHFVQLANDTVTFERGEVRFVDGRIFDRYTAPLRGEDGYIFGRAWYFRDITDRKRVEAALAESSRRFAFLAEASTILAASLDPRQTMQTLAQLLVPELADWVVIEIVNDDATIERVGLHTNDPLGAALVAEAAPPTRLPIDANAVRGAQAVVRTGRSEFSPTIERSWVEEAAARDPERMAAIESAGFRSYICVPLIARGQILGAMTLLASASSERTYTPADLALAEDIARRAALAIDNARLYAEREKVARTLQDSLLPPELPQIPGAEVGAVYRAAARGVDVGGDFYDLFETGDDEWALVIGDVCGKGAAAAAITALARYTIRAAAMQARRPSRVLTQLNEALLRQNTGDRFCTAAYARVAPAEEGSGTRRITLACGGHPLPLILRADGTLESIGAPGGLLGVFDNPGLNEVSVTLRSGDALILYTDGVTEARTATEVLGDSEFHAFVESCRGLDAQAIADGVAELALRFQNDEPRDDIAVVVLRAT
ncbi:MAG: SpoIIE family protein phosphatase, partial [Actinobacteria bacterium]|nr:SpoIIE family protein phosphatase [Actinomycetota bacterium]